MRGHQIEIAPRGSARRIAKLIANVANTGHVPNLQTPATTLSV
jgi:hypothetical protein